MTTAEQRAAAAVAAAGIEPCETASWSREPDRVIKTLVGRRGEDDYVRARAGRPPDLPAEAARTARGEPPLDVRRRDGIDRDHVNRIGCRAIHESVWLGADTPAYATTVRVLAAGGVPLDRPFTLGRACAAADGP
jgi:hypothetical protein